MAIDTPGEPGKPSVDVKGPVKPVLNALRVLVVATALLYAALASTTTVLYLQSAHQRQNLAKIAVQTLVVQCAQDKNLHAQLENGQKYLKDVRSGKRERIQGITDNDIIIANKRTSDALKAYKGLNCP